MSGRLRSAARRRRAGARLAASLVCSVAINLLILALLPVSPRVELPLPPNDVDDEIDVLQHVAAKWWQRAVDGGWVRMWMERCHADSVRVWGGARV